MREENQRTIDKGTTAKGGFTKKQLVEWGVPYPPPRGWKRALILNGFPYKPLPRQPRLTPGIYHYVRDPDSAAHLWSEGADTREISEILGDGEDAVYNSLTRIKNIAKEMAAQ